ncbi:MAG TPA: FxSxx-COOH system tetratricopeptide repeat protein, partial [Ramlibacter sp.]
MLRKNVHGVTAVVAQPQTLQGLGGVGKTQLAIEYAWLYRAHYDFVWWIPADQALLVPSSLAAMAQALGLPPATSVGVEQAAEAVLRALQSGVPYRSWLVIFDNAEEPDYIRDFIPRGPGHVLITSRNSLWREQESTIQVDVFEREESTAFLRKRLPSISDADAVLMAEKLGDLPLALEQAAALLARTLMPVDEYVQLLEQQTIKLLGLEKAPSYRQTMTAAWRLSVAQIGRSSPEAVEVLHCCAFFGPEPIPRDVFRWGRQAVGQRLVPILSDTINLTRALSTLERFALIKVETSTRTLQVHRLNQALLRDELDEGEREQRRHEVHQLLVGAAPEEPDDTDSWPKFEELVAHLEPSGVIQCEDPPVREFALNIARYMYVRGSYKQAEELLLKYIAEWSRRSGEHHPDVLVARIHLGNIYRALTRYTKAYEIASETLAMMREAMGDEHSETVLWASNNVAATQRACGEFLAARELDESTLEGCRQLMDEAGPKVLNARNNLALDYALTSEYGKAQETHDAVYQAMSQLKTGIGRRRLLNTWSNLSRTVRLNGQSNEATDLAGDAYNYGVARLTPDHPQVLLAAKDFAIALRRSGRTGEALDRIRDTHTRLHRLFGEEHADTMAAGMALSNTLRQAGELEEAARVAERVMEYYPNVFGHDHPFTHACRMNIALLTRLTGNPADARGIDEQAHAGLAGRLGRDHDYSISCAINLANDFAALGDFDRARELDEETYRRVQVYFRPDHFLNLMCAANLSHDLRQTGA